LSAMSVHRTWARGYTGKGSACVARYPVVEDERGTAAAAGAARRALCLRGRGVCGIETSTGGLAGKITWLGCAGARE